MTRKATGGETVASRVVDILETFSAHRHTLTLSEISRHSGLPLTTTHRLVGELHGRGVLERGERGRYRIGLRMWELASLAPRAVHLREVALPFLEDLYEATHELVQLAVLDGTEAVYLERIAGRGSGHVVSRVGGRLPVHATGVGLVLIANAPHDLQERVMNAPLARYTRHTVTDPRRLRRLLADVRQQGYAISDRQIENISVSVAAPVRRQPDGEVIAALSIVTPSAKRDPRMLVPAVLSAAHGIGRSLVNPHR